MNDSVLAGILKTVSPEIQTETTLTEDLLALGVKPGGVLLVHSSLRSLGQIPGGAETVVRALIGALGDHGTLLMPAHSYATVGPDSPDFDKQHSPSCVGALTEFFRLRNGTRRSLHPTHSVCGVGPNAEALLTKHREDQTPCGPNSPYRLLPQWRGQILFLGCDLRSNTSMHSVEEEFEPPYLFAENRVTFTLRDATEPDTTSSHRVHHFAGFIQRYDRLSSRLTSKAIAHGSVGQAQCFLLETPPMWEAARTALTEDAFAFVEAASY